MFQIVKYNLLIPIQYELKNIYKLSEERMEINKADVNICKANREFNSKLWFQYCFKEKAFEKNYQMINSPLLQDETYKMTRIEMDSVVRDMIGISKRENTTYVMDKNGISISIGKVRMLFTNNRIGFIHIEILASDIDENAIRKLGYAFSKVTSSQPKISYQIKRSKEQVEDVTISFKEIIERIVALQTYIPISIYEGRITPYMQISLIGSCDSKDKEIFFDSVQALSQRPSIKCIDKSRVYEGREDYIFRFVGDKTVCIYGDTTICGEENIVFLTDIGNGLVKSATENYTTVFAFLISIRLLLLSSQRADYDLWYLLDAPVYLSDEDNIRELFEQCIWNGGWKLKEERELLLKKLDKQDIERLQKSAEEQRQELERLRKAAEEQQKQSAKQGEILVEISQGVGLLVDFVNTVTNTLNGILAAGNDVTQILNGLQNLPRLESYFGGSGIPLLEELESDVPELAIEAETRLESSTTKMVSDYLSALASNNDTPDEFCVWDILGVSKSTYGDITKKLVPSFMTELILAAKLDYIFELAKSTESSLDFSPVCIMYCKVLEKALRFYHTRVYQVYFPDNSCAKDCSFGELKSRNESERISIQNNILLGNFLFPIKPGRYREDADWINIPEYLRRNWRSHGKMLNQAVSIRNKSAHGNSNGKVVGAEQLSRLKNLLFCNDGLLNIIELAEEE